MNWDSFFGILVFMLIAAFSVLNKIFEERKEAERRKTRKTVQPQDLPEATRRQLYGDSPQQPREFEPPVARPRTAPPAARPRQQAAPPPLSPQRQHDSGRPVPPRAVPRPVAVPQVDMDDEEQRPAGWEMQQRPDHEGDEYAQRQRQLQQQLKQMEQRRMRAEQQARRMRSQAQPAAAAAPQSRPPARPAQERQRSPRNEFVRNLRDMFRNPEDLRTGIVFHEILGPPPALREGPQLR